MSKNKPSLNLQDRVVLITGGAGGIGSAVARKIITKGGTPVAVDLEGPALDRLSTELGARGLALAADVTSQESMKEAVDTIVERYGHLDVVVVNAGVAGPQQTLRSLDVDAAERVLNVNIIGAYQTIKASVEAVAEAKGHIIGSCSVASMMPWPLAGAYGASKAALESLLRTLRNELTHTGATAGAVYLGNIATPMMDPTRLTTAAKEYLAAQPAFLTKQISPERAAETVLRGIEERRARTWAPGYIGPLLLARGLMALSDDASARKLAPIMRRADHDIHRVPGETHSREPSSS